MPITSMRTTTDISDNNITPLPIPTDELDLELARRLQREEDARVVSAHLLSTLQDEALARQLDQELRDHQYAQSLQQQERSNTFVPDRPIVVAVPITTPPPPPVAVVQPEEQEYVTYPRRRRRSCIISIVTFILIAAILAGVLYFGNFFGHSPFPYPTNIIDPWKGRSDNGTYEQWKTDGRGLTLTVQNALTDDWYDYFQKAVQDWDATPALTLKLTNATKADPTCTTARGALKVCNSNYGATGWLGINESLLQNNYIYSSVSKMNEYYLAKSSDALKQYVMCHEIGHGFGLPHRDEDYNNEDLGSCLDYSRRPENNMHPNQVDFDHLSQLYLYNNRSRMLEPFEPIPISGFNGSHWLYRKGRLLKKSKHSEVWESILSEQVRIQTVVLLASGFH